MNIYMRLFKRKGDGFWYVELEGKRRSLRTTEATLARKAYRQIKEAYLAGKIRKLTGDCEVTLGEYAEEFLTWAETVQPRSTFRANRLALKKLKQIAGETIRLDRINRKHLDQIVADSRSRGLSVASINNYIRHARASLNKAVEWGYLSHNPLAGAKELSREHKSPNFLTRDEILRFLGSIEDVDLRRLILAYIATGRRRSEIVRLRWEDIDLENGRYFVARAKNHLSRWYPINRMFAAVLAKIGPSEGLIFPRWTHPDAVSHAVKKALKRAGLGHMRLHDLRHTFASLQVMQGRDLRTVQELLGHTEAKTTMIYAHLLEDHVKEAAEINLGPVDLG